MSLWVEFLLNGMSGVIGKTFIQALLVKATEQQCVNSLPPPQVLAYGLDQGSWNLALEVVARPSWQLCEVWRRGGGSHSNNHKLA